MRVLSGCIFLLLVTPVSYAGIEGTVPRTQASDYPGFTELEGIRLGAALLKENEIRQHFVSDLGRGFLVAEVAIYPKEGSPIETLPDRFVLRIVGKEIALRPENPKVIAAALQNNAKPKRDMRVVPHVGIGYESGSPRYDPTIGTYDRGGRGVYTSSGVGVALGGSTPSASTPNDRSVMEIELQEKSLPAMTTGRPVAGHLYFLADKETLKNRKLEYQLEWEQEGKKFQLNLTR